MVRATSQHAIYHVSQTNQNGYTVTMSRFSDLDPSRDFISYLLSFGVASSLVDVFRKNPAPQAKHSVRGIPPISVGETLFHLCTRAESAYHRTTDNLLLPVRTGGIVVLDGLFSTSR